MKIKSEFKTYCLEIAEIVIQKFYQKEFENIKQERLNLDATMLKVSIEKTQEAITQANEDSIIGLSEDTLIFAIGKSSILFQLAYFYFEQKITIKDISYHKVFEEWIAEKTKQEEKIGIEKYFNTRNPHFNHNAYYWHIELKNNKLFEDIEIPFQVLSEYLDFKFNWNKPISTVDKIEGLMDTKNLNKNQKLFIYDKLNGLIANEEAETQNRFSILNIEILDRRWNLEPYDFSEEDNKFDLNLILEQSKEKESIVDQITFLRKKQLELKTEEDKTGFIQEIINSIQIDIDSLHLKLNRENLDSQESIKAELGEMKAKQSQIISTINSIDSNLSAFNETNKSAIVNLNSAIDENFEKLFDSEAEKNIILKKLNKIAKENNKEEWYDQPLKSKIKIMLPLIIFKYEKELDVSNFKFPQNLIDLKRIFINEKS